MTTDRNNEMSADEIRRQLRDAQAEQDAALPGWRRSLDRVLDPESGASTDAKAAFLGVPNRRVFMMGGVALAGGAVLAACSKKKPGQVAETGALPVRAGHDHHDGPRQRVERQGPAADGPVDRDPGHRHLPAGPRL